MAETFSGGVYTDSASGHVLQGSGGQFIPEIWTAKLLEDLESNLVFGSSLFTSREYEGEFRREGDVVHIPHFVDTLNDFGTKKAYDAFASNEMDHAALEYIKMTVGKGSSFRFEVDSLHQLQTKAGIDLMSNLVEQRARKTAQAIDALVAQTLTAAIGSKDLNSTTSKTVPTTLAAWNALTALHGAVEQIALAAGTNGVYNTVVDMHAILDGNNAPQDRVLLVAPTIKSTLLKDVTIMDAAKWGGQAVMPSGVIGELLGTPIMVSPTLRNTSSAKTKTLVRPTHTGASKLHMALVATNAVSLVIPHAEMVAYNPENSFTSAIKSRLIYDAKVIRPEQVVVCGDFAAPSS